MSVRQVYGLHTHAPLAPTGANIDGQRRAWLQGRVYSAEGDRLWLRERELQRLRRDAARALITPAVVLRMTEEPDGYGGTERTWREVLTVRCRMIALVRPAESIQAGALLSQQRYTCLLPWGTAGGLRDRLRIGGVEYEVVYDGTPRTEGVYQELLLERAI